MCEIKDAAGKVGEFRIPSVGFPGTADLFGRALPLPDLGDSRPTSLVVTGGFAHTADAQPGEVLDAGTWLDEAGNHLVTAGQKLTDIATQLRTSAAAFRGIADLLARIVPCDEWGKLSDAIKDAPWRIPGRG